MAKEQNPLSRPPPEPACEKKRSNYLYIYTNCIIALISNWSPIWWEKANNNYTAMIDRFPPWPELFSHWANNECLLARNDWLIDSCSSKNGRKLHPTAYWVFICKKPMQKNGSSNSLWLLFANCCNLLNHLLFFNLNLFFCDFVIYFVLFCYFGQIEVTICNSKRGSHIVWVVLISMVL